VNGIRLGLIYFYRVPGINLLAVLALSACTLPVLISWGLKTGYVDPMIAALRANPTVLEVRLRGDRAIGPDAVEQIGTLPGIGYLEPTTRNLSLRAFATDLERSREEAVTLVPSRRGDPLLQGLAAPGHEQAVVSARLARQFGLRAGDTLRVYTSRSTAPYDLELLLEVTGIVPAEVVASKKIFLAPALTYGIEDFLEGYEVPGLGIAGKPRPVQPRIFANARVFAHSIETVDLLQRNLEELGYFVDTEAASITFVLTLSSAATFLTGIFGVILAIGAAFCLWSCLNMSFAPQRRHIALFLLMGGHLKDVVCYVLVQVTGILISTIFTLLLLFSGVSMLLNAIWMRGNLSQTGVVYLTGQQLFIAFFVLLIMVSLIGLFFSFKVFSRYPASVLRNESY